MSQQLKMPDLATVDGGVKILRWLVAPGVRVNRGDPILEVETDKATVTVECVANGTIAACLVNVGDFVETGSPIAVIRADDEIPPSERETAEYPRLEKRERPPTLSQPDAPQAGTKSFFARNRDRDPK